MADTYRAYIIVNEVTGKGYVGITNKTVARRYQLHQAAARTESGWALHRAMRKYGFDVFKVHTLIEGLSREEALFAEQWMIIEHCTRAPLGYNLTDGGDGAKGYRHTLEWRAELSRRQIGRKLSQDQIDGMRKRMIGWQPTDATRANMAAAQTGRKHPPKTIAKMSQSAIKRWEDNPKVVTEKEAERLRTLSLGRVNTAEHNAAISKANKGKPKSEAHKTKLRKPKSQAHKDKLSAATTAYFAKKRAAKAAQVSDLSI